MRDFRFGFNVFGLRSAQDFADQCRMAESFGFDVVLAIDHLGAPAPFPVLATAAELTERLRVGTLVLNAGFWNAHLLAREVATLDRLTGGRFELGLGAGHMKWEFEAAGIPWLPFAERAARLERLLDELGELFAGPDYQERSEVREFYGVPELKPVQRHGFGGFGPPLLIGGTGDTLLSLAARRADIIGYGGALQQRGQPPGTFQIATAAQMDERVRFVRERLGGRDVESNALVQFVAITDDRRAAAEKLGDRLPHLSVEEVLETPFLLIGTVPQIAQQLRERRERYGFSYITVHGPFMRTLGPVIEHLR